MTKEQQEKEVKELAKEIFKFMHPGDKFRIGNNRTDYIISLAQHLISKGYRKAGELTVISDGRVADLSKIEKKHKLTFGEVMRDIEKTFGVAGNGLKYSQFILDTLDAEREQAYKAQCDHDTFQAVQQAKQDERERIENILKDKE